MRNWLAGALAVVLLGACAQTPLPPQSHPELTFSHLKPIALNVATIEISDETRQPSLSDKENEISYRFPTSPKKAMQNWVRDRLVATGTTGSAVVILESAYAVEEKLQIKDGISGVFTTDQSEKYTTDVKARIEIRDENFRVKSTASGQAHRSSTVSEDISLYDRESSWVMLVEKMMDDFDKVMVENMSKYLN